MLLNRGILELNAQWHRLTSGRTGSLINRWIADNVALKEGGVASIAVHV